MIIDQEAQEIRNRSAVQLYACGAKPAYQSDRNLVTGAVRVGKKVARSRKWVPFVLLPLIDQMIVVVECQSSGKTRAMA